MMTGSAKRCHRCAKKDEVEVQKNNATANRVCELKDRPEFFSEDEWVNEVYNKSDFSVECGLEEVYRTDTVNIWFGKTLGKHPVSAKAVKAATDRWLNCCVVYVGEYSKLKMEPEDPGSVETIDNGFPGGKPSGIRRPRACDQGYPRADYFNENEWDRTTGLKTGEGQWP